ncbi:MAG: hypothetical protein M3440_05710 [Chloroflexota bacterium]|nr:hypothetical protein [Chloroflexota bacterium]
MTHGQPDHDSSTMPAAMPTIPTPTIGAGSAALRTASDDPAELRRLLQRAQERLAFYESFDRIVGENVRRSGELMLERIGLREQAEAQAAEAARDRTEREAQAIESHRRYRGLLQDLMREARTLRTGLDEMQTRLQAAEAALGPEAPDSLETGGEPVAARPTPEGDRDPVAPHAVEAASEAVSNASPIPERTASIGAMEAGGAAIASTAPTPEQLPEPEPAVEIWEAQQVVELIAHGVPRAADALSLQRYLGGLDHVAGVEAREFAEGVLRLQITAQAQISADDIHGWPDHPGARVLQHQPTVIEIDCGAAPA